MLSVIDWILSNSLPLNATLRTVIRWWEDNLKKLENGLQLKKIILWKIISQTWRKVDLISLALNGPKWLDTISLTLNPLQRWLNPICPTLNVPTKIIIIEIDCENWCENMFENVWKTIWESWFTLTNLEKECNHKRKKMKKWDYTSGKYFIFLENDLTDLETI